jgi:DNA (cytosine-5)-methyltransferase 1
MIRLATVFSGIGAPEEALKQLGENFDVVFACDNGERELKVTYDEIMEATLDMSYEERLQYVSSLYKKTNKENFVKQSYFANHDIDEDRWFEDVRFIDGKKYTGKVDILVGGSPCQSFSTYGKKQGFEDTRGTLFFFYANLIQTIRPKVFIYENVPGLKTHDKGNTWNRIQEIFKELDYDIYDAVLNASDYGLPQNRERVFVVGFDRRLGITDYVFPDEIELTKKATDYLDTEVPLSYYLGKKGFEWVTTREKHQGRSRVNRDVIGCQTANQQFNWTGDFRLETPTEEMRNDERIFIGNYEGQECVARKLTPAECLRLMGFNDFKIVVNDNNAYRQSGNSIAVPVLKALFRSIIDKIQ